MSARSTQLRIGLLMGLSSAACSPPATITLVVPDPPAALNGCELVRRARVIGSGPAAEGTSSMARVLPSPTDVLEVVAEDAEVGEVVVDVTELGPCDLIAASGTARVDLSSGEVVEPFTWNDGASCPSAPLSAFEGGTAGGIFTECLPATCAVDMSTSEDGCELQVALGSGVLPCAIGEAGRDNVISIRPQPDGTLQPSGVCESAVWREKGTAIDLEQCGAACESILEAPVAGFDLVHVGRIDLSESSPCSAPVGTWALQNVVADAKYLYVGVDSESCSTLVRADLETFETTVVQAEASVTPLLVDPESQTLLVVERISGTKSLVRFDLGTLEQREVLAVFPDLVINDASIFFEPKSRTLAFGGFKSESGGLLGFHISAAATVAESLYDLRGGDAREGAARIALVGEGEQIDVVVRDLSLTNSNYGLQRRDLATGTIVAELTPNTQWADAPYLVAVPERRATLVLAENLVSCSWQSRSCSDTGPTGWAKEHDGAARIPGTPFVVTTLVPAGALAAYGIDPFERAPGLVMSTPEVDNGDLRRLLVLELDGRHLLLPQRRGSVIDRYRVDYRAE